MHSTLKPLSINVPVFGTEHHRSTAGLRFGDRFLVRLPENPDRGYGWHASKTSGLQFVDSWFAQAEPARPLSGGLHYWSIRTTAPGRQSFRADYWRRDGAGNYPPIIFQIHLNVTGE